jgi:hypothetical protein
MLLLAHECSHQKTALEFMTQRENGPIPERYQLWKPIEREGQLWYDIDILYLEYNLTDNVVTSILLPTPLVSTMIYTSLY